MKFMKIQIRLIKLIDCLEGLGWASLNTGLHGSMAVMIDLRGSSANMENLLRIRSGPANRLKETVQFSHNIPQYIQIMSGKMAKIWFEAKRAPILYFWPIYLENLKSKRINVKGLTTRFMAKIGKRGRNSQSVQESNQISTFYYFRVFLKYFQEKSVHFVKIAIKLPFDR